MPPMLEAASGATMPSRRNTYTIGGIKMSARSVLLSMTTAPVDPDYWLGHYDGFRVDQPGGRLGVVDSVGFSPREDRPDAIVVRTGRLGTGTMVIPAADVAEVRPAEERLMLRSRAYPESRGLIAEAWSLFRAARGGPVASR